MDLQLPQVVKKECYSHGGENRFTLDELLIPFETTINYVKANYLPYFTIYGVSPHLERLNKEEKDKNAEEYIKYIHKTRE